MILYITPDMFFQYLILFYLVRTTIAFHLGHLNEVVEKFSLIVNIPFKRLQECN